MRGDWLALGMVGLLAGAGCATTSAQRETGSRGEATTAQAEAGKELRGAQDAQRAASEQQARANKAEAEVENLQRELAAAQSRAATERARARDLQEKANLALEQGQARAGAAQGRALEAQRGQAAEARQSTNVVEGRLTLVSGARLVIEPPRGPRMELETNENTRVTLDGQSASLADLPRGADVRASYSVGQYLPTATEIVVTSPKGARPPAPAPAPTQEPAQEPGF